MTQRNLKVLFGIAGLLERFVLGGIFLGEVEAEESTLLAEMLQALFCHRSNFRIVQRAGQKPQIIGFHFANWITRSTTPDNLSQTFSDRSSTERNRSALTC